MTKIFININAQRYQFYSNSIGIFAKNKTDRGMLVISSREFRANQGKYLIN